MSSANLVGGEFNCGAEGLTDVQIQTRVCPGGLPEGCVGDTTVCCSPATCASANEVSPAGIPCTDLVGFNAFLPSSKGSRPCPLGLPSLCLDDPSVCCEAATCESALNYNNRDGYDCTGLGEYVSGVQGPIPCPSGTPDSCNPTWCCSLGVNCENCSDER